MTGVSRRQRAVVRGVRGRTSNDDENVLNRELELELYERGSFHLEIMAYLNLNLNLAFFVH